jgi:DNA primase large subunit
MDKNLKKLLEEEFGEDIFDKIDLNKFDKIVNEEMNMLNKNIKEIGKLFVENFLEAFSEYLEDSLKIDLRNKEFDDILKTFTSGVYKNFEQLSNDMINRLSKEYLMFKEVVKESRKIEKDDDFKPIEKTLKEIIDDEEVIEQIKKLANEGIDEDGDVKIIVVKKK